MQEKNSGEGKLKSTCRIQHVHNSCICNTQKSETTQMFYNRWMVEQTAVHSYHEILHSNKKNDY